RSLREGLQRALGNGEPFRMADFRAAGSSTAAWHAEPVEAAFAAFDTSQGGLSGEEAVRRLAAHGPNRLASGGGTGPFLRFLRQFNSLFIYVLLASAGISTLLGHFADAGVILAVVVI